MKLFFWLHIFALLTLGYADETTATTSVTTVWYTTTSNGVLATIPSTYTQTFMTTYTTATASASSGSIGLGSLSGEVGSIRTYSQTTPNAAHAGGYSKPVGLAVLMLNMLL